jgi:hypothetical protein
MTNEKTFAVFGFPSGVCDRRDVNDASIAEMAYCSGRAQRADIDRDEDVSTSSAP